MAAHEARMIRGRILRILDFAYPEGLALTMIGLTLADMEYAVSPALVSGYIDYLEEKGYVETHEAKADELGLSRRIAKLTAKGKDLLEGNIAADPGVNLEAEH
ncbi:MAG: hypothetical protein IMW99_03730 [Firmicutes bacterium]|nr:hypothetical protein [Bacillota bacterium]